MSDSENSSGMHPAEHRAYRELYLSSRQLIHRWERLAEPLHDTEMAPVLNSGIAAVEEMVDELGPRTEPHGVHGGPAARGAGASLAQLRSTVFDRSVDTGLAVRLTVLDIEHVTTLLLQLAELALARGDEALAGFDVEWAKRLRPVVKQARRAAVAIGSDPDRAAAPLDTSRVGHAFHRAGWAVGTLGEWIDRRVGGSREEESPKAPESPRPE